MNRLTVIWLAICALTACSGLRHPLDDSEPVPDTQQQAIEEAGRTLDDVEQAVIGMAALSTETWTAPTGCDTALFGASQGDVGLVLIRGYEVEMELDELLGRYEAYWGELGESSSRSSPSMDPGVVARVNGIGYELTSVPPSVEMRAYVPCY